jgi:CRP-like cAMP-binding protein
MTRSRIAALTSLYLLVVCAVGMLHPVRNALVLGALGGTAFYKVYVASALVAVAVVPFGRLAARIPQQRLTPAIAGVFVANLLVFRVLFPGGAAFGVLFYAWHDLYAGILTSQFFLAANTLLDPRSAKTAFPMIVAAGAVGAALGGAITGFLTPVIGVANLLLVAAALTTAFALAIPSVLGSLTSEIQPHVREVGDTGRATLREVVRNRQVQLIAAAVVLTVLVKQIVDYQFNVATATLGDRDAISAFQGKFNAATQWLPLVAAAVIRPALAEWGVGAALLMLPASMIAANLFVALSGGLLPSAVAKGTETTLRYSAERTGREILYMPVSSEIRVRAKPLIDVALESGVAKALSAGVIFVLLATAGPSKLAWLAVALSVVWLGAAVAERRAYVRALATGLQAPELEPGVLSALLARTGELDVRQPVPAGETGPAVAALVATLRDASDPRVRQRAVRALREEGGPEAIAALFGVASDSALDLALRTDALHALRRVHDEAPNTRVEEAAVQALVTEHLAAAERYASAGAALRDGSDDDRDRLLRQSVAEAWETRQAAVFDGIAVIHEPRVVDGCYRAIIGSDERRRAEAIELIEESGSRHVVRRFDPILRPSPDYASLGASGGRAEVVAALRVDDDTWVAQCAVYAENNGRGTEPMEVIERVFLLQRVDVFADTPSHHLARIALLVKEVEADGGALLLQGSEKADALYVVIDGELRAERPGRLPRSVGPGEAVGALAVLDDAPIGVDVRAARRSRLLRLTRRDLRDLLEDYPDLAVSLLRGMATRLRWLVELAVKDVAPNARPMRVPVADRAIEQQAPPP